MNTTHSLRYTSLARTGPVVSGLASVALLIAIASPAVAAGNSKEYVLFVGTDLAVKQDGQFYHVVGAGKDVLKVDRDRQVREVKQLSGAQIKISRGVKLSSLAATISNVRTDSYDRAAAQAQFEAMRTSMMLTDEANLTEDRMHGRMVLASAVAVGGGSTGGDQSVAGVAKQQREATSAYTDALPGVEALNSTASTFYFDQSGRRDSAEVSLSFDVSSPEPIENAYLVIVANYGDADKIARQISTRELKRIDDHPRRIKVSQAASISGLAFKNFDFGVYAGGQEVATNLSDKRMPLTADQAYQFFLIDYLSSHAGATTPPVPMLMTPRTEFRQRVGGAEVERPIYAQVDKSGMVVSYSEDEAGTGKLSASLESALRDVRFMPALQNGTPVDGRVKLTLSELLD